MINRFRYINFSSKAPLTAISLKSITLRSYNPFFFIIIIIIIRFQTDRFVVWFEFHDISCAFLCFHIDENHGSYFI